MMIKATDIKQNNIEGFEILVDFGKIYIKCSRAEDFKSLVCLALATDIPCSHKNNAIVFGGKSLKEVVKCFNQLNWAKMPRKIYTPVAFGGSGEQEKGYGVDFVQGRR